MRNVLNQEPGGAESNCKPVMNTLRRVFSFRKRPTSSQDSEESTPLSMEMQPVSTPSTSDSTTDTKPAVESLPSSSRPSTSASTARKRRKRTLAIYEDPFVAILPDGRIFVKHYYNFNPDIQYHTEGIEHEHIRLNCRVLNAKDVDKVFYAPGPSCNNRRVCKDWGICINSVWWASHLTRAEGGNPFYNVVLIDNSCMYPGFSVINIEAFAECIQSVGLPRDAPFQPGVPSPPLNMLRIPFIDDDEPVEEEMPQDYNMPSTSSQGYRTYLE
ncbi:unnamed protein product [Caenorhabditis brenneri]